MKTLVIMSDKIQFEQVPKPNTLAITLTVEEWKDVCHAIAYRAKSTANGGLERTLDRVAEHITKELKAWGCK